MIALGVFSHLVSKKAGSLGAVDPASLVDNKGQLTPAAAQAIWLLLSSRYPSQTGSGRIIQGAAVPEPAFDPAADYQTLLAMQQGSGLSVYDQIKSLPAGQVVLVDLQAAAANISGQPTDLPYAIAKNQSVAQVLMPAAQAAILPGGPGSVATTGAKSYKTPIVGGLVIGGVTLLASGNPIAAVAAGAAGGYLLSRAG